VQVVGLAPKQIDQRLVHALDLGDGDEALVDEDGEAEDAHVHADHPADVGVEELDGDLAAVVRACATCTWPSEAAARGSRSMLAKSSSGPLAEALLAVAASRSENGCGGT
jgi:hypothetical protein